MQPLGGGPWSDRAHMIDLYTDLPLRYIYTPFFRKGSSRSVTKEIEIVIMSLSRSQICTPFPFFFLKKKKKSTHPDENRPTVAC